VHFIHKRWNKPDALYTFLNFCVQHSPQTIKYLALFLTKYLCSASLALVTMRILQMEIYTVSLTIIKKYEKTCECKNVKWRGAPSPCIKNLTMLTEVRKVNETWR
jgi:hypothetical protein